jgi:hypothetical protein
VPQTRAAQGYLSQQIGSSKRLLKEWGKEKESGPTSKYAWLKIVCKIKIGFKNMTVESVGKNNMPPPLLCLKNDYFYTENDGEQAAGYPKTIIFR